MELGFNSFIVIHHIGEFELHLLKIIYIYDVTMDHGDSVKHPIFYKKNKSTFENRPLPL